MASPSGCQRAIAESASFTAVVVSQTTAPDTVWLAAIAAKAMSWFIVAVLYDVSPSVTGVWWALNVTFQPTGAIAAPPSSPATLPLQPASTSMILFLLSV